MPFVPQDHRAPDHLACTVGDLCYVYYRKLVDGWKKEERWTTWHNQVKELMGYDDYQAAKFSALLVHFKWNVEDYELKKEMENGPIL